MPMGNSKNKMGNFSKSLMSIMGITIVIVMFLIIWYWESYGRVKLLYKDVIVLREDVKKGTLITEDMIAVSRYEQSTLMKDAIVDVKDIIGKESKHFIPGSTPLSSKYFDDSAVLLGKDTYIFKIPSDWILSVPDSIRRKDKAVIFEVNSSFLKNYQQTGSDINTYTPEQLDSIKSQLGSSVIVATVAYVKDNTNKEIRDSDYEDRINGSAKIGSIELILNSQQISALQNSFKGGNKFIILYSDNQ